MEQESVLRTFSLTKLYGGVPAVDHVSMNIGRGEIYGFVGRNGAGKTTLMRMVGGLIRKSGGGFELFGCPDADPKEYLVRRRLGAIIEAPAVYPSFTAYQNLEMQCLAGGVTDTSVIPRLLERVGLAYTGKKKAKDFSLGMRQRLGIAAALVGKPEFLILDEPVNGLDPQGIVEVRELLKSLNREEGITVFVSSHILGELSKLATKFGFIERGRLLQEISASELEHACRKSVTLYVDKIAGFADAMRALGVKDYRVISANSAEVFAELPVSALAFALRDAGIDLLRVIENDVDLERYFIDLIGRSVQ